MHIRLQAQFIVPSPNDELKLVATLQRLNIMNEEAIVKTNLKDYLFHTSTLCACDEKQFSQDFDEAEKRSIVRTRAQEASSGKRTWYPLTQPILDRLVYGVKINVLYWFCIELLSFIVVKFNALFLIVGKVEKRL
ncbi:hypothetical protein GOP47_0018653 [Adiantum capillus-veneris]|uniref:Uncharacterized protein n=1 Tax=Adiantum capillus-veneris TaxID=13818 RepID=A0A9D4UEW2_ADICA|nr:hypothetical protein GOP47_0018653 [Adiantum capillus-veneris]